MHRRLDPAPGLHRRDRGRRAAGRARAGEPGLPVPLAARAGGRGPLWSERDQPGGGEAAVNERATPSWVHMTVLPSTRRLANVPSRSSTESFLFPRHAKSVVRSIQANSPLSVMTGPSGSPWKHHALRPLTTLTAVTE